MTIRGYTCSVVVLLNYASLPATLTPHAMALSFAQPLREGKLARRGHYDVIDGAVAAPGRGLLDLTHHVQASTTVPSTTCLPFSHGVAVVVINCDRSCSAHHGATPGRRG